MNRAKSAGIILLYGMTGGKDMSHNHVIIKCRECGIIIAQCRCAKKDKEVIYQLCSECQKKVDKLLNSTL